jgi:hypothetical protein
MPANAANPAMGTSQAPGPPGVGGEADVACAIHCCDQKAYKLPDNRGGKNTCQRLACRKHSCVLHSLREKTESGNLTTKNKLSNVLASPRCSAPGIGRTLIPDTIVGGVAIDAKFPCDPSKVKFGKAVKNLSLPKAGSAMETDKELSEYNQIDKPVKVSDSKAMTPADAAASKGDCKC